MFSKLEVASTFNFEEIIHKYFNEDDSERSVPIPDKIKQTIKRIIAAKSRDRDSLSTWQWEDGYLTVRSKEALGDVEDTVLIGPSVNKEFTIDAALVDRVIDQVDNIIAPIESNSALALLGQHNKFLHLIANYA